MIAMGLRGLSCRCTPFVGLAFGVDRCMNIGKLPATFFLMAHSSTTRILLDTGYLSRTEGYLVCPGSLFARRGHRKVLSFRRHCLYSTRSDCLLLYVREPLFTLSLSEYGMIHQTFAASWFTDDKSLLVQSRKAKTCSLTNKAESFSSRTSTDRSDERGVTDLRRYL